MTPSDSPHESQTERMRRWGVAPKKSLGQNFLADPNSLDKLARALRVEEPAPFVVEIGPGLGALTDRLLAAPDREVLAVELDDRLAAGLRGLYADEPRATIVHGDALAFDFLALARVRGGAYPVFGNLPYSITSPLLFRMLEQRAAFTRAGFLLQKEVAVMLAAAPGGRDYGLLSALVGRVARVRAVADLRPGAFLPPPKVDSRAVEIVFGEETPVADERLFTLVVKAAFHQRRKKLVNSLATQPFLPLGAEERAALAAAFPDLMERRAETLTPTDYVRLADALAALRREKPGEE